MTHVVAVAVPASSMPKAFAGAVNDGMAAICAFQSRLVARLGVTIPEQIRPPQLEILSSSTSLSNRQVRTLNQQVI